MSNTAIVTDESCTIVSEMKYTAFGEIREMNGSSPTDYLYTGQRKEVEFGLSYYVARWYDATLAHFTSADTLIPQPGDSQAWDRYAYVLNNPLKYIDPSGHWYSGDQYDEGGWSGAKAEEEKIAFNRMQYSVSQSTLFRATPTPRTQITLDVLIHKTPAPGTPIPDNLIPTPYILPLQKTLTAAAEEIEEWDTRDQRKLRVDFTINNSWDDIDKPVFWLDVGGATCDLVSIGITAFGIPGGNQLEGVCSCVEGTSIGYFLYESFKNKNIDGIEYGVLVGERAMNTLDVLVPISLQVGKTIPYIGIIANGISLYRNFDMNLRVIYD